MGSRNQLKDRVRPFFLGPPNKARNSSSATSRPFTIPKVTLNHPKFSLKMKWIILSLALFASACAEDFEQEDGEARLGYITVGSGGATTLTFNATSIQNAVILGLFILVLGALVLPLFGVSMDEYISDSGSGSGYGYGQSAYDGYQQPEYGQYSKRSVEEFGPIVDALHKAEEHYQYVPTKLNFLHYNFRYL